MHTNRDKPAGIMVGTSGYAYNEWVEAGFYPPGTGTARMLMEQLQWNAPLFISTSPTSL
jgi:hypothetical protein